MGILHLILAGDLLVIGAILYAYLGVHFGFMTAGLAIAEFDIRCFSIIALLETVWIPYGVLKLREGEE